MVLNNIGIGNDIFGLYKKGKGKVIPLQARCDPESG